MFTTDTPAAADMRAEIARRQMVLYRLAPLVPCHPLRLGQLLNGKKPMTPEMARAIARAIDAYEDV